MRVFLSYSWTSEKLADSIEKFLISEKTFQLIRDKTNLKKLESINNFMLLIRDCEYCILIINNDYLKSLNCIYELSTLFIEKDFKSKVIPIIYKDTNIFNVNGRNVFVQYWKQLFNSKSEGKINYQNIEGVLESISDINSIIYDDNAQECCDNILKLLYDKIFNREIRSTVIRPNDTIILPDDPILCIDFGTSYTLSSIQDINSKTHFIPDLTGKIALPSLIEFLDNNTYVVGHSVLRHSLDISAYVVRNIKRLILTKKFYTYGTNDISIIALIGAVFKSVSRNAQEYLGRSILKVILSVPTDFGIHEIKIIEKGAEIAGLEVTRMIQEASSSSLLIAALEETELEFINIDLGGGTIDISIAEAEDGICEVRYSLGNKKLGSIDYDNVICEYIVKEIQKKYNLSFLVASDLTLYSQIQFEAERIKIKFNNQNTVYLDFESVDNINGNIIYYDLEITKDTFKKLTQDINLQIKSMLLEIKKVLYNYHLASKVKHIYLTGQGTKLFLIRDIIMEVFPEYGIIDKYQENAVTLGLSLQSGIMCGTTKELILLDNLHICVDVRCNMYDNDTNTICFSNENNFYFNLISPRSDLLHESSTRTIPIIEYFKVCFGDFLEKEYEIQFYDYSLNDKKRIYINSLHFTPKTNIVYYIKINVDANGNLETSMCTEKEMLDNKMSEERRFKAFLAQYQVN